MAQVEVITNTASRRVYTEEQKLVLLATVFSPGLCVPHAIHRLDIPVTRSTSAASSMTSRWHGRIRLLLKSVVQAVLLTKLSQCRIWGNLLLGSKVDRADPACMCRYWLPWLQQPSVLNCTFFDAIVLFLGKLWNPCRDGLKKKAML